MGELRGIDKSNAKECRGIVHVDIRTEASYYVSLYCARNI